jgi:hypothetical protein
MGCACVDTGREDRVEGIRKRVVEAFDSMLNEREHKGEAPKPVTQHSRKERQAKNRPEGRPLQEAGERKD